MLTGTATIYDAAREALAQVGLAESAERVVAETSYGERRRLELAMALAQKPKLLCSTSRSPDSRRASGRPCANCSTTSRAT